ncbi:carbohydrate-binding protein [Chitinispirillales bacterium ANBcel5]|uniref:hypothetical protein n=1 Tax=Cellulosispirillum alkaliphilum TaxID=3039283 RepID=UPI002A51F86B|nr:carbohydrate-binding protein [Chitinispirillales bacterium ANBcel5]
MNVPAALRIMRIYPNASNTTKSPKFCAESEIIIQNMGADKTVSIWGQRHGSVWEDCFGKWAESLPENKEKWITSCDKPFSQFVIKYDVNGMEYWDNNDSNNYMVSQHSEQLNVITGQQFPVVMGEANFKDSKLKIFAAIQNRGKQKSVGLLYTTDQWKHHHTIKGKHSWTMDSGIEVWLFEQELDAPGVEFALFCKVGEEEFWDNNFGRNYTVSHLKTDSSQPKPENSTESLWDKKPTVKTAQKSSPKPTKSKRSRKPKTNELQPAN